MRTTVQLQHRSHIASLPTARLEFACAARFPAPNSPAACIALSETFVTTRGFVTAFFPFLKVNLLTTGNLDILEEALLTGIGQAFHGPDCGLCGNGPPAAVLAGPSRRARGGRLRGLRTGRRLEVKVGEVDMVQVEQALEALAQALADVLQGSDALLDLDEPCAAAGHVTSLHII